MRNLEGYCGLKREADFLTYVSLELSPTPEFLEETLLHFIPVFVHQCEIVA